MSDPKLRDLERRWRETGNVDDEALYLRERVRAGDLTQERLDVVRFLRSNHSAALVDFQDRTLHPINVSARRQKNDRVDLILDDAIVTRLVQVILSCGRDCWVRTGMALTRRALEVWLGAVTDEIEPDRHAPCRLLAAVREVALNGASERFEPEVFATDQVMERQHYRWGPTEVLAPMCAVKVAQYASRLASIGETPPGEGPGSARALLGNLTYEAALALSLRLGVDRQGEAGQLRGISDRAAGLSMVLYALAEELVPWALGTGDPITAEDYLARLSPSSGTASP
jgi:hypothetical protein